MQLQYTVCGLCERLVELRGFGVCSTCLLRISERRIINCKRCHKDKQHHSRDLCDSCFAVTNRTPEYHRIMEQKRRKYDRDHVNNLNKKYNRDRRLKKRLQFDNFMKSYKTKCVRCGYNKCTRALDFHHKNPKQKSFNVNIDKWTRFPLNMSIEEKGEIFLNEMKKCILLCSNCHREIEDGLWNLKELEIKLR